jgi:hypothetical protein
MADVGQINLLRRRGKRTDLMQQGKAIRHTPVLNKLPVAKAAYIDHVDCDGLAGTRINACRPATRPNGIFRLDRSLQREFQVLNAPPCVFDLRL